MTHLNFFRIHVIFFTLTPLIFSGIFYVSNGRYPVAYIDALFNSVSAMTMCGLATVNLSQLTAWQQVLLFIQMCIGNTVIVSWVMVYTRRHYFAKTLNHIIGVEAARQATIKVEQQLTTASAGNSVNSKGGGWSRRFFRRKTGLSTVPDDSASGDPRTDSTKKLRPDMIRRMDGQPKPVNPSGWITESDAVPMKRFSVKSATSLDMQAEEQGQGSSPRQLAFADEMTQSPTQLEFENDVEIKNLHVETVNAGPADLKRNIPGRTRRLSTSGILEEFSNCGLGTGQDAVTSAALTGMPRTATIEFVPTVSPLHHPLFPVGSRTGHSDSPEILSDISGFCAPRRRRSSVVPQHSHVPLAQRPTIQTHLSSNTRRGSNSYHLDPPQEQMLRGFGGFPMPHDLLGMLFGWLFPSTRNRLKRTVTIPVTTTLTGGGLGRTMSDAASIPGRPTHSGSISAKEGTKPVTYISFDAIVGRNSAFHFSTNEQLEELGGVEYRALNALLWLVASYHITIQLVSFVVIAPYMSLPKWASNFEPPAQFRIITVPWFSLFQVISAYTNTGISLVDQNMVPFQTAYPMILFMIFCILAGNTAFPILLRFLIWTIKKLVPRDSRLDETLHFLLDHPRRCFIYLFPSYQTWFLVTILVIMNLTDWFCFLVLDIGNPDIDSIPLGTRVVAGLYQAIAVRTAGFGIVPLARIAPAVKVMYVIMMYISAYPIALSVRSTNVYEEQSLGIYDYDESEDENAFSTAGPRMTVWSRYLAMHARQQLAFDMWWLCLALVLICTIERGNLDNTEIQGWFNIFTIMFELVSAYGTVGLSLGIPTENYSFSGAFKPLSKLILCLVMLRGRHRGLPVAIDRAIMFPSEFKNTNDEPPVPVTHDDRQSSPHSEFLHTRDPLPKEDGLAFSNEGPITSRDD
ncbi:cation transport protein-domain-containing protein [Suillus americanus]|nr:cation transport protein-domain-containing protein [Suillus americanus]